MKNNYLIESNDFVTIDSSINKIIKDNNFVDEVINTYDLEESLLEQVLEDLDTYSFLSPKKVIIIKNASFLESTSKIKFKDEEIEHLLKYIDNPSDDVLLIICCKKLDVRKKISKELKKKVNVVKTMFTPEEIITEELNGYKISFKAKNLLIDYTNENISLLQKECEKLKLYKLDEKEITDEDVKRLVFKVKKDNDKLLFDLINYMVTKDKKNAFKTYLALVDNNLEPLSIIALLESQLRLIYQIMLSKEEHYSTKDLADILKVHSFRIEKSIPLTRHFTKKELQNMLCDLAKLDLGIKSGEKDSQLGFKLFLINL